MGKNVNVKAKNLGIQLSEWARVLNMDIVGSTRRAAAAAAEARGEASMVTRFGCRNRPFYRVMAADSRSPRDGKHLEVLGYYNPLPGKDGGKRMGLKFDRVKYWLSVGAQPSDPVQRILFRAGLLPPPPMLAMARKGGPRDRRPIHPMTGRPLDLEGVTVVDDSNVPEGGAEEPFSSKGMIAS
uniref:30S ribosomal protein S16 n=1 Tax=Oryza barthii TaxID=65489 RepID=A0A0D3H8I3_9ORYZ